jgi:hypothetical protein
VAPDAGKDVVQLNVDGAEGEETCARVSMPPLDCSLLIRALQARNNRR